ncbi:MAG: YceI family protein [Brachymonas sp.]|jgi:polyisoprenoid-binding protein YceI
MKKTVFAAVVIPAMAAAFAVSASVQAAPVTFKADPTHTFVTYETIHKGISTNRGRFDKTEAVMTLDRAEKTGSVSVKIDPASVNTGVDAMNKHLQGADFFDVAKHPEVSFKGDKFTFDAQGQVKTVTGELSIVGKSHPVVLTAERFACNTNAVSKVETCGGDFKTTIKRDQWGMNYALQYPGMSPDVHLLIQVEAASEPAAAEAEVQ